jgi:hypothetical protein
MRVGKKEIREREAVDGLLSTCHVGRLGTIGKGGFPMVKPLNFVYWEGKIYLHSAPTGEKIDDIRRDDRVCFEVDVPIALKKSAASPCSASYLYESVIVTGRARLVEDRDERLLALTRLMEKYQPEGGYGPFPEEKLALTAVIRIDIVTVTGKRDLGEGASG